MRLIIVGCEYSGKTTLVNEIVKWRNELMGPPTPKGIVEFHDHFTLPWVGHWDEISEKDMFLRGSGDFFGTNQSGLPKWKFFLPYEDIDFLDDVKNDCKLLLNDATTNRKKIDFLINTFYGEKEFLNYFSA